MTTALKSTSKTWKTAIISGGGTGLGRSLAILLAKEGYKVGILARSEEPLREVSAEISKQSGFACFRVCDVNDSERLQTAIDELVIDLGGRLDLMIINAAMINFSKEARAPN
ncbi:SDR family NAD(P)-dependent oxidoreductase, partial [Myxococcota bacterium]|nr:SDR family NAD(P)-dependent oxidoreductase [Myxococcota bacterium]